jgi:hypothetical protein
MVVLLLSLSILVFLQQALFFSFFCSIIEGDGNIAVTFYFGFAIANLFLF